MSLDPLDNQTVHHSQLCKTKYKTLGNNINIHYNILMINININDVPVQVNCTVMCMKVRVHIMTA